MSLSDAGHEGTLGAHLLSLPVDFAVAEPTVRALPIDLSEEALNALGQVLAKDSSESIGSNSIAFVTPNGLSYPADELDVATLSAIGTAVLQKLEGAHYLFAGISSALASEAHPKVSVSAYISTAQSHKLGMHADMWDNLVVQLSGEKIFNFESFDPVTLRPGGVLTIPQALKHDVTTPESSIHLSIVLLRKNWISSQGWL